MFHRSILTPVLVALGLSACSPKPAAEAVAPVEATPAAAPVAEAPIIPPPPPADPLAIGTQDAKDDLYCSGVILASYPTPDDALSPTEQAILVRTQNYGIDLGDVGVNKLIAEKLAHATHVAIISDAYIAKAAADIAAKKVRIPLETCLARAQALPPPE